MSYLNAEQVFSGVSLEQSPFRRLTLQQVGAHGHLSTRDVGSEALAHAPERQIPTLHRKHPMSCEKHVSRELTDGTLNRESLP